MVNALFSQSGYLGAKKMMDATVMRHEAISRNIANVETPGYRRVDLAPSFEMEFQNALKSGNGERLSSVQPSTVVDLTASAVSQDGNTVRIEDELLQLSQNTTQHAFELQVINGSLARMRLAITGKS